MSSRMGVSMAEPDARAGVGIAVGTKAGRSRTGGGSLQCDVLAD